MLSNSFHSIKNISSIFIFKLLFVLLFLISQQLNAVTRYVGDGGYSTIQAAVDASGNGDVVIVKSGTYNEIVSAAGKWNLTIMSETGYNSTTVIATSGNSAFTLGPYNTLSGFTIYGSSGTVAAAVVAGIESTIRNNRIGPSFGNGNRFGIKAEYIDNLLIENNIISYCASAAISLQLCDNCIIQGNTISNNSNTGIASRTDSGPQNVFTNNTISSNNSFGIELRGLAKLRGNLIENNGGYGVMFYSGTVDLGSSSGIDDGDNTIRNNDSDGYQLYNASTSAVNAYYNFWGYTDETTIDAHIWDDDENASNGKVSFNPWNTSDQSLPVTLTVFSAVIDKMSVVINWVTESEVDNLGFILERREKGEETWIKIASFESHEELKGQGNSSSNHIYSFTDISVVPNFTYEYRLSDVDIQGNIHIHDIVEILVKNDLTKMFKLDPAFPNPFNPQTKISYNLSEETSVYLSIIDLLGRHVSTLFKATQKAGNYNVYWNGSNDSGELMSSGIYMILLDTPNYRATQKVMLIR